MKNTTWSSKIFIRSLIATSLVGSSVLAQAELIDSSTYTIGTQEFPLTGDRWLIKPKFSFPQLAMRRMNPGETDTVTLRLTVDTQGNIEKAEVVKSSGNLHVDRFARQQVRRGKILPFIHEGKLVKGMVTIPVTYVKPKYESSE
ncbi:energy transducer TonB [Psychrobacter sp. I-STPA10]|uniref:energy transducer TonB n=1 Tax=Psychrobacter sp. I-STPA10 TaxID=2585769 RepID=UPI001E3BC89C|nr:energy transducer TonB [Psychrobacter sp. I-STPA10]